MGRLGRAAVEVNRWAGPEVSPPRVVQAHAARLAEAAPIPVNLTYNIRLETTRGGRRGRPLALR